MLDIDKELTTCGGFYKNEKDSTQNPQVATLFFLQCGLVAKKPACNKHRSVEALYPMGLRLYLVIIMSCTTALCADMSCSVVY